MAVFDVWKKRRKLSPELLAFVRSKPVFGSAGQLTDFVDHMWNLIYKTWKPHLLAFFAFSITVVKHVSLPQQSPLFGIVSVIAFILMVAAFIWLTAEIRRGI